MLQSPHAPLCTSTSNHLNILCCDFAFAFHTNLSIAVQTVDGRRLQGRAWRGMVALRAASNEARVGLAALALGLCVLWVIEMNHTVRATEPTLRPCGLYAGQQMHNRDICGVPAQTLPPEGLAFSLPPGTAGVKLQGSGAPAQSSVSGRAPDAAVAYPPETFETFPVPGGHGDPVEAVWQKPTGAMATDNATIRKLLPPGACLASRLPTVGDCATQPPIIPLSAGAPRGVIVLEHGCSHSALAAPARPSWMLCQSAPPLSQSRLLCGLHRCHRLVGQERRLPDLHRPPRGEAGALLFTDESEAPVRICPSSRSPHPLPRSPPIDSHAVLLVLFQVVAQTLAAGLVTVAISSEDRHRSRCWSPERARAPPEKTLLVNSERQETSTAAERSYHTALPSLCGQATGRG